MKKLNFKDNKSLLIDWLLKLSMINDGNEISWEKKYYAYPNRKQKYQQIFHHFNNQFWFSLSRNWLLNGFLAESSGITIWALQTLASTSLIRSVWLINQTILRTKLILNSLIIIQLVKILLKIVLQLWYWFKIPPYCSKAKQILHLSQNILAIKSFKLSLHLLCFRNWK